MRGINLTAGRGDRLPFAGFCQRRPLHVVDHRGLPWIEIDSPTDYWRAYTHIAPVLDDAVPAAGTAVRRAADHV